MNHRAVIWRTLAFVLFAWAFPGSAAVPWYNPAWTNRLAVTINADRVTGTLTNFPVLINITSGSLQQYAQADGDDILFTSSDGTTKLAHEIESYSSGSGTLVAWVKVPALSSGANTTLYLYFRNSGAANQQNATAVWDSNFKGVWHLGENSGTFYDSTANNHDGVDNVSATGKTGKIGSGQQFDGLDDYINAGTFDPSSSDLTLSVWARWNGTNGRYQTLISKRDTWAMEDMRWVWSRDRVTSSILMASPLGHADSTADVPDTTTWHLYTVTRSGTTCTLYKDGVPYGVTSTLPGYANDTTAKVLIGGLAEFSEAWNGYMDEARISSGARSAAWISTEYNNQNSPSTFYSLSSVETRPSRLAITTVNDGRPPTYNTPFSIVVQAQDANGNAQNVIANTTITISRQAGSGALGGTLTAVIPAGASSVTISALTYSKAETAVSLNATRNSGDTLTAGTSAAFSVVGWHNTSWTHRIPITIDRSKVSGSLTDFPVLIQLTNSLLQQYAKSDGSDLLFTSDDGTAKLAHEIESYTSGNGGLIAWVKVPSLSSSADKVLYLYFGNSAAANQQNAAGVWDSNFRAVWHLKEDAAGTGTAGLYVDSTANANNANDYSASTSKLGRIGSGQSFNGTSDYLLAPHTASLNIHRHITLSAWVNYTSIVADNRMAYIVGKGFSWERGEAYYLRSQRLPAGAPHAVTAGSYSNGVDYSTKWNIAGLNTNQWHHVVGLYDGTSWHVYVDGTLRSSTAASYGALTNTLPVAMGAYVYDVVERHSHFRLDEVRISSAARSSDWIATEFANQSSPATFSSVEAVETAPVRLAITSVNNSASPAFNTPFSIVVESHDAAGNARSVLTNTAFTITRTSGSGTLGGTITGTIPAGSSSVTVSGLFYSRAESAVVLTATRTSGEPLAAGSSASFTVHGWTNAWSYRLPITIDRSKVAGSLTNFPVVIQVTNTVLQLAQSDGDDLWFSASDGVTKLSHEIETFTAATGSLVAWVKIPLLSSSSDTVIYLHVGNASAGNQQNAGDVWDSSYKGVWHLKQTPTGVSGDMPDSTTTANHGTSQSIVSSSQVSGKFGGSIALDGTNDYISTSVSFNNPTSITVQAWVKTTSALGRKVVGFSSGQSGTSEQSYDRHIYFGTDGAARFGSYNGTNPETSASLSALNDGEWHHIVGFRDAVSRKVGIYIDGVLQGTPTTSTGLDPINPGWYRIGGYRLGGWAFGGGDGYFSGTVDEVRVSHSVRSAGWIATEFNNQNSPSTFYGVGSPSTNPPTQLVISSVNGGANPVAGTSFSVVVQSRDATGTARPVLSSTAVALNLNSGSGPLGGTLSGTIPAGSSSVVITNLSYTRAESGVRLTVTRTGGMVLASTTNTAFTVNPGSVHHFVFSAIGTQTVGTPFAITLTAKDVFTNTVTTFNESLALSVSHGVISPVSTGPFSAGARTLNVSVSSAGSARTITATRVGNTQSGTSAPFAVNSATTSVAVASSANPSLAGSNVTFTATVTAPGGGTPSGTVHLLANGTELGFATLAGGVGRITNSSLAAGSYTITARYIGNTDFRGSTNSMAVPQIIASSAVAGADEIARQRYSSTKVHLATLLENDSGFSGDVSSRIFMDPASRSNAVILVKSGWVIYVPPAGFTNVDRFTYAITNQVGAPSIGTVDVTIHNSTGPSVNVLPAESLGNGSMRLRFQGIPGRLYTIQFAEDLESPSWQTLGTATADSRGGFEFTDNPPPESPARSYRSLY